MVEELIDFIPLKGQTRWMEARTQQKIRVAMRFVLFGVGGFWLLMYFSLDAMEKVIFHHSGFARTSGLVSALLALFALALILFGVREWGKWLYASAFLSIPACLMILALLPVQTTNRMGSPLVLAAILGLVSWGVYRLGHHYYQSQSSRH